MDATVDFWVQDEHLMESIDVAKLMTFATVTQIVSFIQVTLKYLFF